GIPGRRATYADRPVGQRLRRNATGSRRVDVAGFGMLSCAVRGGSMPVSERSSRVVYEALKASGIGLVSALPETWLVHLIRMAEDDPSMILVRLAKEEEGVGISAGAHFAGVRSAMLMQNHGFLASINGIVSFALLYRIPLLM